MLGRSKKILNNYQRNSKFTAISVLGLLILCFIFLLFHFDNYANIVTAFIFFILAIMVLIQILEYFRNPQSFSDQEVSPIREILEKKINFIKDFPFDSSRNKSFDRLQKSFNTFTIILFFLIYGVSSPTRDNILAFIVMVIALFAVNIGLFYYNFGDSDKKVVSDIKSFVKKRDKKVYNFFAKHVSRKDNLQIGIVNFCVLAIILIIFGIDFSNYLKFASIGFALILLNSMLITDVKNKMYE